MLDSQSTSQGDIAFYHDILSPSKFVEGVVCRSMVRSAYYIIGRDFNNMLKLLLSSKDLKWWYPCTQGQVGSILINPNGESLGFEIKLLLGPEGIIYISQLCEGAALSCGTDWVALRKVCNATDLWSPLEGVQGFVYRVNHEHNM